MRSILSTLLMLPCIALAEIHVDIKVNEKIDEAAVLVEGKIVEIIPDEERDAWKLNDNQLKDAVKALTGARPDDAYLKSSTPWGDLYTTHGWPRVRRNVLPVSAKILRINSTRVVINSKIFENNSTVMFPFYFKYNINGKVNEQLSSSWSSWSKEIPHYNLHVGQKIFYTVRRAHDDNVEGTSSISYENSWGESTMESKSATVEIPSGVVDLKPGQSTLVSLTAFRGTMVVEVDYFATLSGHAACHYSNRYKGHYYWNYDIIECLEAVGSRTNMGSTETLTINFYYDAKVVLTDVLTSKVLAEAKGKFF